MFFYDEDRNPRNAAFLYIYYCNGTLRTRPPAGAEFRVLCIYPGAGCPGLAEYAIFFHIYITMIFASTKAFPDIG